MRKRTMLIALVGGLALALPGAAVLAGPWDGAKGKAGKRVDRDPAGVTILAAGKGRLGISLVEISPELRVHLGAPRDRGALINTVRSDSPAARAGIAVGDVVTEVDGDAVEGAAQVLAAMSDRKKGESVNIALVRNGKAMTVSARMDQDPGSVDATPDAWRDLDRSFQFGMPGAGATDRSLRRDLDRAEKRIQELEKRLDKLDHTR